MGVGGCSTSVSLVDFVLDVKQGFLHSFFIISDNLHFDLFS